MPQDLHMAARRVAGQKFEQQNIRQSYP